MNILLIEDDKFFQHFYVLKLTEAGFNVEVANNGEEGLAKARTIHPALILLDLIMPKKDGFEFMVERNKDPNLSLIPIIVFSTLGQEQDMQKAKTLGAVDYVNKTFFDFPKLLSKIQGFVPKA